MTKASWETLSALDLSLSLHRRPYSHIPLALALSAIINKKADHIMASRTSKAHKAKVFKVCALSKEHMETDMEVHAKRRKILGKGTGGREGYLLFFRRGLANLAVADLQICSSHLQTSAEKVST
jgi:hypothetical protein